MESDRGQERPHHRRPHDFGVGEPEKLKERVAQARAGKLWGRRLARPSRRDDAEQNEVWATSQERHIGQDLCPHSSMDRASVSRRNHAIAISSRAHRLVVEVDVHSSPFRT